MKKLLVFALALVAMAACRQQASEEAPAADDFVRIEGHDLINPDGSKLFIMGTNLGNWLNPEGYMFGFKKTNSGHFINEMICQLVGPDAAREFWAGFKDNYITRKDIEFIASTGANTIRLPFNYKIFTNEDFMGLNDENEGFRRVDSVVEWCRDNNLYLILDMHDTPGGQTGDNIDDSYGYPWLFESEASQKQFADLWRKIADRYKNETVILGYELCNEPIAPYFANVDSLNALLEPTYKRATAAIREVDNNHIILLGGSQWNSNFKPFSDWKFDDKIMYTCHRYGGAPTPEAIGSFIAFRDSTGLPMYMGEIGHNTPEWQAEFCQTMRDNNIGYTFWPYKKIDNSSFVGINRPAQWDSIVSFSEADRGDYFAIRAARPDQALSRSLLNAFLDSARFENCVPDTAYILSLGMK